MTMRTVSAPARHDHAGHDVHDDHNVDDAVAFILRSTRQRPQTASEIDAKLTDRSYAPDVRVAALSRAREIGAVDDVAFARAWVADRGEGRGYGVPRLRQELARRGVPELVAEEALAALGDRDVLAVATELAHERCRRLPDSLEPEAVARRLVGFLVRRGYEHGLARRVAIAVSGLDRTWD